MSFPLAEFSKYDAMFRANVVAGKAVGAMFAPLRMLVFECDVLRRANVGTSFARYASFSRSEEVAAGKVFVEERAQNVTLCPRKWSGLCASDVVLGINVVSYFGKQGNRSADFVLFDFIGVYVEARQSDVRIRHDERECSGECQADVVQ